MIIAMGSKKRLILLGAGAAGCEILSWLLDVPESDREWTFAGFLDDQVTSCEDGEILGKISGHRVGSDNLYLCTIGTGEIRQRIGEQFRSLNAQFITAIHPTARIDRSAKIGLGSVLGPFSYVGPQAIVGNYCLANIHSSIGHHVHLGRGCTLNSHVDLTGFVEADESVTFGSHACVLQKVKIGKGATVGAGSVVVRNVPAGSTVFGVPAKRMDS